MNQVGQSRFPLVLNVDERDRQDESRPPLLVCDLGTWEGFQALKRLADQDVLYLKTEKVDAACLQLQNCLDMPSHLFVEAMMALAGPHWLASLHLSLVDWDKAKWRALPRFVHEAHLEELVLDVPTVQQDVVVEWQLLEAVKAGCELRGIDLKLLRGGTARDEGRVQAPGREADADVRRQAHATPSEPLSVDFEDVSLALACELLTFFPEAVRARLSIADGTVSAEHLNAFENVRDLRLTVKGDFPTETLQTMLSRASQLKALNITTQGPLCRVTIEGLATMLAGVSNADQIRLKGVTEPILNPYVAHKFNDVLRRNQTLTRFVCFLFTGSDELSLLHHLANPKALPLLEELDLTVFTPETDRRPAVHDALCQLIANRGLAALTLRGLPGSLDVHPRRSEPDAGETRRRLFQAIEASTTLTWFSEGKGISMAQSWGTSLAHRLASRLILNNAGLFEKLVAGLQVGVLTTTPREICGLIAKQARLLCTGGEMQRTAAAVMLVCQRAAAVLERQQAACLAQVLQLLDDPGGLDMRRAARRIRMFKSANMLTVSARYRISARLGELKHLPGLSFPTIPKKLKKLDEMLWAP